MADVVLTEYARAALPSAPASGTIVRVKDDCRDQFLFASAGWFSVVGETLNVREWGAIGNGGVNPLSSRYANLAAAQLDYPHATSLSQSIDWAAIQGAINASGGRTVLVPPGTFVINSQLSYITTNASVFSPGLRLTGSGSEETILDHRVPYAALLKIDTTSVAPNAYWQRSILIRGIQINGGFDRQIASDGLFLRHSYHAELDDLHLTNLSGTGITVQCMEGDTDSSNWVAIRRARINSCQLWGVNIDCATGKNEVSFVSLDHSWITQCGTDCSASPPTSGGMRWKGQILAMRDCGFTENQNISFYNYGGAGQALQILATGCAFENTKKGTGSTVSSHIRLEGVSNGRFINCQMYSNDIFRVMYGMLVDATTFGIENLVVDGMVVKATSMNNPYTAFEVLGTKCDAARIRGTTWVVFDDTIQTRFGANLLQNVTKVAITDQGITFPIPEAQLSIAVNVTSFSYKPDVTRYKIHKLLAQTGASMITVDTPTTGAGALGKEMVLHIQNSSGGPIVVNFSGLILVKAFVSPINDSYTAARFYLDTTLGWIQIGSWS